MIKLEQKEHFTKIVDVEKKELSDFRKRFNEGSTVEEAMNRSLLKIRSYKYRNEKA